MDPRKFAKRHFCRWVSKEPLEMQLEIRKQKVCYSQLLQDVLGEGTAD